MYTMSKCVDPPALGPMSPGCRHFASCRHYHLSAHFSISQCQTTRPTLSSTSTCPCPTALWHSQKSSTARSSASRATRSRSSSGTLCDGSMSATVLNKWVQAVPLTQIHVSFGPVDTESRSHPCFSLPSLDALLTLQRRIYDHHVAEGPASAQQADRPGDENSGAKVG